MVVHAGTVHSIVTPLMELEITIIPLTYFLEVRSGPFVHRTIVGDEDDVDGFAQNWIRAMTMLIAIDRICVQTGEIIRLWEKT